MPDKRQTIEIPANLVEVVRSMGEGYEAAAAKVKEADLVRGEKADAMMDAVSAALAVLEPLRAKMDPDDWARLGAMAGYTISDAAWIDRAEKAIAQVEAIEAAEKAEQERQAEQARSEFPLTESGELDIDAVPESVRAIVVTAWSRDQQVKTREAAVAAKEQAQADREAAERVAAEEAEVRSAMEELTDLPGDKVKREATLLRAKRTDEQLYSDMLELWRQEVAGARAPITELGSSHDAAPVSGGAAEALSICAQRANKLMDADPSLTRTAAEAKVWENDPKLYEMYRYDGAR